MDNGTTAYRRITIAVENAGARVVHSTPDRARAQCPAHRSRGLSLSLARSEAGALLHCFAGCDVALVLAEVGLNARDLFDEVPDNVVSLPARRGRSVSRMPPGDHLAARAAYEALPEAGRAAIARQGVSEFMNTPEELAALGRVLDAMEPALVDYGRRSPQ